MYTKSIGTLFQQAFVYILYTKSKELMPAKCCIQNVYNNLLKCGIHFVYKHFVHILYNTFCIPTKCIQKFVKIWDIFCIQTFCIHFATSILIYKKCRYIINIMHSYNLYTKFIQNVYTNNYMQNGSLISTYLDPFVVHFLT